MTDLYPNEIYIIHGSSHYFIDEKKPDVSTKYIRADLCAPAAAPVDYELIAPVAAFFGGNPVKTKLWFETVNPMLGGVRPLDTPRDRLLAFIGQSMAENMHTAPVDLDALKRELAEKFNEWNAPDDPSTLVSDIVDHLATTRRLAQGTEKGE